jgi:hypothetical protein
LKRNVFVDGSSPFVLLKLGRVIILVLDNNVHLYAGTLNILLSTKSGGFYRNRSSSLNWWFCTIIGYNLDNYFADRFPVDDARVLNFDDSTLVDAKICRVLTFNDLNLLFKGSNNINEKRTSQ